MILNQNKTFFFHQKREKNWLTIFRSFIALLIYSGRSLVGLWLGMNCFCRLVKIIIFFTYIHIYMKLMRSNFFVASKYEICLFFLCFFYQKENILFSKNKKFILFLFVVLSNPVVCVYTVTVVPNTILGRSIPKLYLFTIHIYTIYIGTLCIDYIYVNIYYVYIYSLVLYSKSMVRLILEPSKKM